jgi:hypothetical protein
MQRPAFMPLIAGLLVVVLLGGAGIYVMGIISGSATPAAQDVMVIVPAGAAALPTNTNPPALTAQPARTITQVGTAYLMLQPAGTLEPTHTLPATFTPTFTLTSSVTSTASPTITLTPTNTNTPVPGINGLAATDYLPVVSLRAREIYAYGLTLGNGASSFSRLGDCHSSTPGFLGAFDSPSSYRLGSYGYLQDTINYYAGDFDRPSQAAYSGLHMGSFFSPLWANPDYCRGTENVMDCEYRLYKPSVIFISIGTLNMQSPAEEYERFVRPVIEFWINKGVVPIINTKADNIEGDDRFNDILRKLARDYDVPLWDFARVARTLPNNGLQSDNVHLNDGQPYFDDPSQMLTGWTLRNLTGLQALDALRRGLQ